MYAYKSLSQALVSIVRQGPSELLRGFLASSLRDAPYSGLFLVFYEEIKRDACRSYLFLVSVRGHRHYSFASVSAKMLKSFAVTRES